MSTSGPRGTCALYIFIQLSYNFAAADMFISWTSETQQKLYRGHNPETPVNSLPHPCYVLHSKLWLRISAKCMHGQCINELLCKRCIFAVLQYLSTNRYECDICYRDDDSKHYYYWTQKTGIFDNQNTNSFTSNMNGVTNPIITQFTTPSWPVCTQFIATVLLQFTVIVIYCSPNYDI